MRKQFISLILIYANYFIGCQTAQCGDWYPYKDEKCIKIFDNKEFLNYSDAKNKCNQLDSSSLVTIRSEEEQQFLFNMLLNNHKILNDIWIGAKLNDKILKWTDNTTVNYTNWAINNPRNHSGYDCVQISMDEPFNGKWVNEPCDKQNLFVCEKMQNWLVSYLQKTVMDLRESLEITISELKTTKNELINAKNEIQKTTKSEIEAIKTELRDEIMKKGTESCPPATIAYFASKTVPIGWLKANGQTVSRVTYSNLFNIIGTQFGSGDGSNTFSLPDLRAEFIRGWSDGRDVDKNRAFGSFQLGSNIPFAGYINNDWRNVMTTGENEHWGWVVGAGVTFDNGFEANIPAGETRDGNTFPKIHEVNYMTLASNRGNITNYNLFEGTRPRNVALLACIKY